MNKAQAREVLIDYHVRKFVEVNASDLQALRATAEQGHKGYRHMLDAELVESAIELGLQEYNDPVAEAIEVLVPGRLN